MKRTFRLETNSQPRRKSPAGVMPPEIRFGGFEQGRGAMQMALALPAPFDVDALKDLALQRCAQALHVLKAVLPGGLLQPFERSNAELGHCHVASGLAVSDLQP